MALDFDISRAINYLPLDILWTSCILVPAGGQAHWPHTGRLGQGVADTVATISEVQAQVGKIVTVTTTSGKQKNGVMAFDGALQAIKLKKPGGGPGRPAIVPLDEIHSFVVNGAEPLLTSEVKPKATRKPRAPKPTVAAKVSWQEAAQATIEGAEIEVAAAMTSTEDDEIDDEVEVEDEPYAGLRITLPTRARRCPYSGEVVTKENGFRISFYTEVAGKLVEQVHFYDKNVPEIAALIVALVNGSTGEVEDEEADE